jgi:hypothetical protein
VAILLAQLMVLFSQPSVFLFQHRNTLFELGYLLHQHRQKLLDARRGALPILAADLVKHLCERLPLHADQSSRNETLFTNNLPP